MEKNNVYIANLVFKHKDQLRVEFCDSNEDLDELIQQIRENWLEEEPAIELIFITKDDRVVATLMHGYDWRVCLTTYAAGRGEVHEVEYRRDEQERIEAVVSPLGCLS